MQNFSDEDNKNKDMKNIILIGYSDDEAKEAEDIIKSAEGNIKID